MNITFYEYPSENKIYICESDDDFTHLPRIGETIDLHTTLDDKTDVCIAGRIQAVHWETVRGIIVGVGIYVQPSRKKNPNVGWVDVRNP